MVGKRLLNKNYQVTGIAIDKVGDAQKSLGELILELANATAQISWKQRSRLSPAEMRLEEGYAVTVMAKSVPVIGKRSSCWPATRGSCWTRSTPGAPWPV